MRTLVQTEIQNFHDRGILHLNDLFDNTEKKIILENIQKLSNWPDTPGKWMKYYEPTTAPATNILCRIENFIPYLPELEKNFNGSALLAELEKLMQQKAVLFKEKINFKLPGGGGFLAHQDAPAFTTFNQTYHITCMYCIDDATIENGCLEFSYDYQKKILIKQAPDGTIDPDTASKMQWAAVPTKAGDIVFFDSFIPHRSQTNCSSTNRTAIFLTYNRANEGMYRDEYYQHKREVFPQDCERVPGKDYSAGAEIYNLGNPIR